MNKEYQKIGKIGNKKKKKKHVQCKSYRKQNQTQKIITKFKTLIKLYTSYSKIQLRSILQFNQLKDMKHV